MKNYRYLWVSMITLLVVLASCGGANRSYQKQPIDDIIKSLNTQKNFTVILYDMDYDESKDAYQHQYQILKSHATIADSLVTEMSPWYTVSDEFFQKHQEDMGMEIVSKKDGVVKKTVSPAGYSNYVGNEKYGRWEQRNGENFWSFYGKYMFLSSMFRMSMYPVSYGYYNGYYNNYYRYNRPYYGHGGRTYGTNSSYNRSNKSSRWNKRPSSFKQGVRNRVKSSTASKRRRSTSRYRSGSAYRSRGGGFGK